MLLLPTPPFRGVIQMIYQNAFHPYGPTIWVREPGNLSIPWRTVDPTTQPGYVEDSQGPTRGGSFNKDIELNQVFDYVMFHDDQDPNHNIADPPPDARLVIAAVGAPADLYNEVDPPSAGGTWFLWPVTTRNDTFAVLEVSTKSPIEISPGMLVFEDPPDVGTIVSDGFKTIYEMEIASENLLPGNSYHALLRLVDRQGSWQVVHREFSTKRCTITITLDKLHIVDDGVAGDGRGYFNIWIVQKDPNADPGLIEVGHFYVPEQDISDRPDPGKDYQEWITLPSQPTVIGPMALTSRSRDIALLTRGFSKQTFSSDIPAGNFLPGPHLLDGTWYNGARFLFYTGQTSEEMSGVTHFVDAKPFSSDEEFRYSVRCTYSVTYMP